MAGRLATLCASSTDQRAVAVGPLVPAGALCVRGDASVPWLDSRNGTAPALVPAIPRSAVLTVYGVLPGGLYGTGSRAPVPDRIPPVRT